MIATAPNPPILKNEITQARLERAIRYAQQRTVQLAALRQAADAAGRDASVDSLTGLGNRRAFDQDLARLIDGDQSGGPSRPARSATV